MTKEDFIKNLKKKKEQYSKNKQHLDAIKYFNSPDYRFIKRTLKQVQISEMMNEMDELNEYD